MVKLLIIFQAGEIGNSIIHRYKSYDEIRFSDIRFAFADKDSTNKFWKKLYGEENSYDEIKKRVGAEFAYTPSNGVIHRYGNGIKGRYKAKRKANVVPPSSSTPKQAYCTYCGSKLKGV